MNTTWFHLLVCPESGGSLVIRSDNSELWCKSSGLAYPIEDGIPVLLIDRARKLSEDEKASL